MARQLGSSPISLCVILASLQIGSVSAATAQQLEDGPVANFYPRLWIAAFATALYGVSTLLLWFRFSRTGGRFMLTLTIGMSCMTLGLAVRAGYAENPYSTGIYIVTTLFVLLSPCAFLAMDYVLLNRLALTVGTDVARKCLLIPARIIVRLFVYSDISTFLLQATGGSLTTSKNLSTINIGNIVTITGLSIQLASFIFFTLTLGLFGFNVRSRYPHLWNPAPADIKTMGLKHWRSLFFVMLATCVGITIRSVFRIAEYAGGYTGYLATHEGYFYCLDSLPLFLAMSLYIVWWPPLYVVPSAPKDRRKSQEGLTKSEPEMQQA
ncbi:RTA1-domain-containing protein [Meredithblackwellia eburnea MCA 4105]